MESFSCTLFRLDDYYEQHVVPAQKFQRPGFGRNPSRAELRRHFQRTHFFGPAYRDHAQANLANQQRVEDLHRQIRELKKVLEMKTNAEGAQKRREGSSSRFASNARASTSSRFASRASAGRAPRRTPARRYAPARDPEDPATFAKLAKPKPKPKPKPKAKPQAPAPLILKIGDEIIYDEGYKSDPIWMPSDASSSAWTSSGAMEWKNYTIILSINNKLDHDLLDFFIKINMNILTQKLMERQTIDQKI